MWKEVKEAKCVGGYRVEVLFNDGVRKVVDLAPLTTAYPVFAPLRDEEMFRNFTVTDTLEWDNGEIDIAPEYLYEHGEVCMADSQQTAVA